MAIPSLELLHSPGACRHQSNSAIAAPTAAEVKSPGHACGSCRAVNLGTRKARCG